MVAWKGNEKVGFPIAKGNASTGGEACAGSQRAIVGSRVPKSTSPPSVMGKVPIISIWQIGPRLRISHLLMAFRGGGRPSFIRIRGSRPGNLWTSKSCKREPSTKVPTGDQPSDIAEQIRTLPPPRYLGTESPKKQLGVRNICFEVLDFEATISYLGKRLTCS